MRKILIIDEDDHVRYSFRRILEGDYQIIESRGGEEALSNVGADEPDLVIMDMKTRRRSDLKTFERIRELSPQLPVIVMSSYGSGEARRTVLELGAYGFVLKPFNIEELRELVRKAVRRPQTEGS